MKRQRRSIITVMVASLLLVTLLPAHYHLHHIISAGGPYYDDAHMHAVDLHLVADNIGDSHHSEGAHVFSATPNVLIKKNINVPLSFLILTILLVLLPLVQCTIRLQPRRDNTARQGNDYLTPPLRAPPLH